MVLSAFGTHYRSDGDVRVSGGAERAGGCVSGVCGCVCN